MGFSRAEKDPGLERILEPGDAGVGPDDELAAFAHALRATYRAEPARETVARHLTEIRLAAAALPATQTQPRGGGRATPLRRLALTLAALAVLPVLATGLAFAGVALPGPAGSAFERIGIELPNQSESGTESPSGGAAEPAGGADDPASESAGSELGRERRNGANGREASRFGRCVAREARGGAKHPNRLCAAQGEPRPRAHQRGQGLGARTPGLARKQRYRPRPDRQDRSGQGQRSGQRRGEWQLEGQRPGQEQAEGRRQYEEQGQGSGQRQDGARPTGREAPRTERRDGGQTVGRTRGGPDRGSTAPDRGSTALHVAPRWEPTGIVERATSAPSPCPCRPRP